MVATVLVPPQEKMLLVPLSEGWFELLGTPGIRRVVHLALLVLGVMFVTSVFTMIARKHRQLTESHVVFRIGFLGIAIAGLIGLATMLPYSWKDLAAAPSPLSFAEWIPLVSFVILFRIALLPLVGLLASSVTFRLSRPHSSDFKL